MAKVSELKRDALLVLLELNCLLLIYCSEGGQTRINANIVQAVCVCERERERLGSSMIYGRTPLFPI